MSNPSDLWFLLRPLLSLLFIHGARKSNKKLLYIRIDKQLKKRIWEYASQSDFKFLNLMRKYKIQWIYILVLKILNLINR